MSLYYKKQIVFPILGTKVTNNALSGGNADPTFVITPATLTNAYTGNISSAVNVGGMAQAVLNVQYTCNNDNDVLNLKLEFSGDASAFSAPVNWFQEVSETTVQGTTTEILLERKFDNNGASVHSTTYKFRFPVEIAEKFIRVSAKETGGGTAGSVYVELIASGN